MNTRVFLFAALALLLGSSALADGVHRPFVLASVSDDGREARTEATVAALEAAGFTIAGWYQPLDDATVIVATSDALLQIAAASDRGGYAAGQRISVTERNGRTEVAFVNPLYLQYAYRLGADMQPVRDALAAALGEMEEFGSEKGLSEK